MYAVTSCHEVGCVDLKVIDFEEFKELVQRIDEKFASLRALDSIGHLSEFLHFSIQLHHQLK